jgi:hypothetical protein
MKDPLKAFSGRFNLNVFNAVFNDLKDDDYSKQKAITVYEPTATALVNKSIGYTELGQGEFGDFSGSASNTKGGLEYTDYKQAYTNRYVTNVSNVSRQNYRSVDELEKNREKINYQMNDLERQRYDQHTQAKKNLETQQQQRITNTDQTQFKHFSNANQSMIRDMDQVMNGNYLTNG